MHYGCGQVESYKRTKKGTAVKEVAKLFAISKTQVYDIYKHIEMQLKKV